MKVVSPERLFGTRVVSRGRVRVQGSDPPRTLFDLLDDPELGGGIRHVADVLAALRTAFAALDRAIDTHITEARIVFGRSVQDGDRVSRNRPAGGFSYY
ncbi:MAG: hypothetical protein HYV20_11710 [Gemmatimonadetes bacterium]|nr:hypothetical protein [Gemmatimonadota bacterium]